MLEDFFVTVLLAAAAHQDQAWVASTAFGIGEGAFEVDEVAVGVGVVGGDGFFVEAVWGLGCLWTAELVEGVGGPEGDGFFQKTLAPSLSMW